MGHVFAPGDEQGVVDCVVDSAAERTTLEIVGGGSRRGVVGCIEAEAILDVSRISGIVDYDPTELVLTARAGTTISEINALLSEQQQMLAFEPTFMGNLTRNMKTMTTLGGSIASNAAGPRRVSAGAARDHFLGFRAVSGRGEAFKSGGRVVKNVTGFDLPKLLAGSWGTLAVLTEITVRVMPKPRCGTTLAVAGLEVGPAGRAMARCQALPCSVTGAAYLPGPAAERSPLGSKTSLMLVRLEGLPESVEARARTVGKELADLGPVKRLPDEQHASIWTAVAEVAGLLPDHGPVWRLSVPAGKTEDMAERLSSAHWLADWGGGLIWYCSAEQPEGCLIAHRGCWRDMPAVESKSSPQRVAHRVLADALKAKFDPCNILNPGRGQNADAVH